MVQKICEIYKIFHDCFAVFQRQDKNLGFKIENLILEVLELALKAIYLPHNEKIESVKKISDKIDFLKYLIRLAHEIEAINTKKYFILQEEILSTGKICGGWLKTM